MYNRQYTAEGRRNYGLVTDMFFDKETHTLCVYSRWDNSQLQMDIINLNKTIFIRAHTTYFKY